MTVDNLVTVPVSLLNLGSIPKDTLLTVPISLVSFKDLLILVVRGNQDRRELLKLICQDQGKDEINRFFSYTLDDNMDVEIFKFFIEEIGVDETYNNGILLRIAVSNKLQDIIKYLVEERKVDINLRDGFRNPIGNAYRAGNLELMKYLIEHGADINTIDLSENEGECKAYIEAILNPPVTPHIPKLYFGIKVVEKLECSFPGLVEIEEDNKYYYVFLIEGPQTKETLLSRFAVFKQLKEDTVAEFYLL